MQDVLSDADLVCRAQEQAALSRRATAGLVAHLALIESRGLHLRAGYSSLFTYCRDALQLSEHAAFHRVAAARAARRFPVVLQMIASGALNLTALKLLAPHLTPENHIEVLDAARGSTKMQVELLVARLAPWPDVPSCLRKLPSWSAPATLTPLSPSRYKVELTIGSATLEKLQLARDLLRHTIPAGEDEPVFDRALQALLTDLTRRKFAATDEPHAAGPTAAGSRHIPAEVKRAVFLRDLGRCAFIAADARRCGERGFLEFHHVKPFATGGEATTANIQLRCRQHNDYEARLHFADRRAGPQP